MITRAQCLALLVAASACGNDEPAPSAPPPPPPPPPADAATDGITQIGSHDPESGAHLDDDEPHRPPPSGRGPKRPQRPVEIMLRSTPNGAKAYVDGVLIGPTPTFWLGETGAEHEFTFVAPQHALARYRFWPIQTGVLHARLEPVSRDVDAGVPPPHLVQQPVSITPPETLIVPADAAVVTPPPVVVTPPPVDAAPAPTPAVDAAAEPSPF